MVAGKTIAMKNLKNRKLYLQVYDELKDYILQNQLKAGDKLPTEMEMCGLLGVSRNVLREAIKSLEISGIVHSKPGVGIMIQEFNADFLFQSLLYNLAGDSQVLLQQTLEVRRTLELGFLEQSFASLLPEDFDLLDEQVDIMCKIYEKSERVTPVIFGYEFYEADASFHHILYSRTNNDILKSMVDAVWACDKYHKNRVQRSYMEQTVQKHEQIVSALRARSMEAFKAAMHYHFDVHYKPNL